MRKRIMMLASIFAVAVLVACSSVLTPTSFVGAQSTAVPSATPPLENSETHDDAGDYVWDEAAVVEIALNGDSISVDGTGATVTGSVVTITAAGTYRLTGSLTDGQIVVNSADEVLVRLILNGVTINSSTGAPIYVIDAEETMIVLADGTQNTVSDGTTRPAAGADTDEPNAAIFSEDDLTIYGNGSLTVSGNYNDGIASEDGLVISSGTITVYAVDDGIRGKNYLAIAAGTIAVQAGGDGLKSDNADDATQGYITIDGGTIQVTSGGDAITAATDVIITGGMFTLTAGGGSSARIGTDLSAKGIKGLVSVVVNGGSFAIDTADDAIHSNGSIAIYDGTFAIATGDDAMHADATLDVNGGEITVTQSYEGLESAIITINAGVIHVVSSDDGLNVVGGNDGSGMMGGPGRGGRPGQDAFATTTDYFLTINGGYIVVDAAGDGIDINGAVEMTDGVLIINGPTQNMNGALDYDVSFNITGGFLVAAGSAGMAQAPSSGSAQPSALLNFNATIPAGTLIHIQTTDGTDILTFAPTKNFQSVAFSSSALVVGTTYEVYAGGSSTGTMADNLYQGSTYSGGTLYGTFTLTSR
ncbi:MAG: carbohydrate-binding domain-containing protein [Anaerolineae bacterium]|nr:carbohydrate-binding domain-containing protein [Anaerolineae bacterium]